MNPGIGNDLKQEQSGNRFLGISTAVAFPALVIFFVFLIIPSVISFICSFKDYSIVKGIAGSPGAGLENFRQLVQSVYGPAVIKNTFFINSLSIIFSGLYVFILTLGIAGIRNRWVKGIAASLAALPVLIPVPVMVGALTETGVLLNPSLYRLSAVANEVFCIAPAAVVAGVLACTKKFDIRKVFFIALGYAAIRLMLLFSSDINYILASYNPLVYEKGDVIDTFIFRKGLLETNVSVTSAFYVVKVLLQLIPAAAGTAFVILMSGKINRILEVNEKATQAAGLGGILSIAAIVPAALFIQVLTKSIAGPDILSNPMAAGSLANSFIIAILSFIPAAVFSLCLAYGLVVGNKFILIVNSVFLLLGGNMLGQYLIMKSFGLVNTYMSVILANCLYAGIGAYYIFFAKGGINRGTFGEFLRNSFPVLITMFGMGFARFFGSIVEPMIYINNPKFYPISAFLRTIIMQGGNNGERLVPSTAVILLIPAIIGVICIIAGIATADKKIPAIQNERNV